MEQHKLLLAVNGFKDREKDLLRNYFIQQEIDLIRIDIRIGKVIINEYLKVNVDTTIILMSQFQGLMEFTPKDIDEISVLGNRKIIIVLNDNLKSSDYVKYLLNYGIYNAIFEKDATHKNIIDLVIQGREKQDARNYYGVKSDDIHIERGFDTTNSVRFLAKCRGDVGDLEKRINDIELKISTSHLMQIIADLPEELFVLVERIEKYKGICNLIKEKQNFINDNSQQIISEPKKNLTSLDMIHVPLENRTIEIGFVGVNIGVGCTTNSIICAHSIVIKNKNARVAIVEFDNRQENFASLCKIVTSQSNISGMSQFKIGQVDYFFHTPYSKFIEKFKGGYDYIIYDFGCCTTDIIEEYIVPLNYKFVVADINEWKYGENIDFLSAIQSSLDQVEFLFSVLDDSVIGNMRTLIKKGIYISYEKNPYRPSKKTIDEYCSMLDIEKKKKKSKFRRALTIQERSINKIYLNQDLLKKITLAVSLGICLVVLLIGNFTKSYQLRKARQQKNRTIQENQIKVNNLTKEIEKLTVEGKGLEQVVYIPKVKIKPGEVINNENTEKKIIKADIDERYFLEEDQLGEVVSIIYIDTGAPIYQSMVAIPIEDDINDMIDDLPDELNES